MTDYDGPDVAGEYRYLKKLKTIHSGMSIVFSGLKDIERRDILDLPLSEARLKIMEMLSDQKDEIASLMERKSQKSEILLDNKGSMPDD